ncbi:AAA family ATPase [Chloroflexi bacterium TSY]|nr:AAA family ATPase [Chloroflexi bacterium TSY]
MNGLDKDLREILAVACTEGEEFTVEVIAQIQEIDPRILAHQLRRELEKRFQLVEAQGVKRRGQRRLSRYRFRHNLYQKYLYNRLSEAERSYLHEDIAITLEELYADQRGEIAGQLAWHYQKAELPERAIPYLQQAGDKASEQFALQEAMSYFSQGLSLLESLSDTPDDLRLELKMQTALSADLQSSLRQLQSNGQMDHLLPVHGNDAHGLEIPENLYGREQEIETLVAAFERVSLGAMETFLVMGHAGIGKTSLIHEIQKPIVSRNGYFIRGKFDQLNRNVPYSAIIQAFQELVRQIMTESPESIARWKSGLLEALGSNGQVVIDVLPELEQIVGKQPSVAVLGATEAQNRFNLVFSKFARVFAQKEHPLVLFLDDLQWADLASLHLLQTFAVRTDESSLFLIGAYRENEVDGHHPLSIQLDEMRERGARINEIALGPLKLRSINHLVADILDCEPDRSQPLAELVLRRTEGNPFFVRAFLTSLYEEELLYFDPTKQSWFWELANIEQQPPTENVVELMVKKINRLSAPVQETLKLAACIGNRFDLQTLATVREQRVAETEGQLARCIIEGLIVERNRAYEFRHDRIQEAAYLLIPPANKTHVHYTIGQLILEQTPDDELTEKIFEIVDQLNLGRELFASEAEKVTLAQLNLIAGKKAQQSTAYEPAVKYLRIGLELLATESWESEYELTFELYKGCAECEFLSMNFEQSQKLFEIALRQATTNPEKADICALQVVHYMTRFNYDQAIRKANAGLHLCGIDISETEVDFLFAIQAEEMQIENHLARKELRSLFSAPPMVDESKMRAMQLLPNLAMCGYLTGDHLLFDLGVLKGVNLSLQHGQIDLSAYMYTMYAVWLVKNGRYREGAEFAKFAIELSDRYQNCRAQTNILNMGGVLVIHSREHLKHTIPILTRGYHIGFEAGDIMYGTFNYFNIAVQMFAKGDPLPAVLAQVETAINLAYKNQIVGIIDLGYSYKQLLLFLRNCHTQNNLADETFEEAQLQRIKTTNHFAFLMHYRLQKEFWFRNHKAAYQIAKQAEPTLCRIPGYILVADHYFLYSLILTALYSDSSEQEKEQYRGEISACREKMKVYAENCPENFRHKSLLIEAEIARIEQRNWESAELYDQAIDEADKHEFLHIKALANECTANFWLSKGREKVAKVYLTEAYSDYERWGATAKVKALEEQYPALLTQTHAKSEVVITAADYT